MLSLRPVTVKEAKRAVGRWHRHCEVPSGGLFAVGVERAGQLCGVAIVGRPIARPLDDGWVCEITRVATDGSYNACSMLYGACARAAKALGYRKVITYTLASEPGASLRAAGFEVEAELPARPTWNCPARQRMQTDLFGEPRRPPGPKVRWARRLAAEGRPVPAKNSRQPR